jgi:hypothetical protein
MRLVLCVAVRERTKGDVTNRNLVAARSWTLLRNEILMGVSGVGNAW